MLPPVAIALLFHKLFQSAPVDGLVNSVLINFGVLLGRLVRHRHQAFVVIVVMDLWRSAGFYAVLLYAGLLDIPDEMIESARIDGASGCGLSATSSCRCPCRSCSPRSSSASTADQGVRLDLRPQPAAGRASRPPR